MALDVATDFAKAGAIHEGDVEVNVSYDIIRQFSQQLYTNPRKAIEELICNSYDAGAKECWVKVPLTSGDSLFVLDNGVSMDFQGLRDLWKVATSPKVKEGVPREANGRSQIGKFGVGKLAAFALGKRLTHVACKSGKVRVVSVGESEIREKGDGGKPTFEVRTMNFVEARSVIEPYLKDLPIPWERNWETWTLAIIGEIPREGAGAALRIGILRNMITAALPISPDFKVFVEKELVETRKPPEKENALVQIDVTDPKLRVSLEESLQAHWQQALGEPTPSSVPEKYYKIERAEMPDPEHLEKKLPAILVPELGLVSGKAVMTETNLSTPKETERGYASNGFAIKSHGKLVNPEDELFGVSQRTHKYWRRFRADVEIPGLDDVLLVQRNQVSENSPQAQVTRVVMRSLFNYTRNRAEQIEETPGRRLRGIGARLRVIAPILIEQAFRGLDKSLIPKKGLDRLDIDFVSLGEDSPASSYDPKTGKVKINEEHPIFKALYDLGRSARSVRQMLGELLVGTELTGGYLNQAGVDSEVVEDTKELFDVILRGAASSVRSEVEELIEEIEKASYEGGRPFEDAVVKAFRSLKIAAKRIGGADEPDGVISIIKAPVGVLRVSVEAKGSGGVVTHKVLSESTVDRHRKEQGCTCAVAIAREYQEEGKGRKESGLIREAKGKLPLLTTEGIAVLLRLHEERPFNSAAIEKILMTWVHPSKLVRFIESTWRKLPDLGKMKLVLTVAEDQTRRQRVNYPEPAMLLTDRRIINKKMTKEEVIYILKTIQITTGDIVFRPDGSFEMLARPSVILRELTMDSRKSRSRHGSSEE